MRGTASRVVPYTRRMRSTSSFASLVSLAALTGCSAVISPDPSRLFGDLDGGLAQPDAFVLEGVDAFVPQVDAYVPEGVDADLRPADAWAPDAVDPLEPDAYSPMGCVDGSRCEGEVAVVCIAGIERRTNCASEGLICEAAVCRPMRCVPGTSFCSADGTGLVTCNDDGSGMTFSSCPTGCDPGATTCRGGGSCAGLPTIALGDTRRIDLCASGGSNSYARSETCNAMSESDSRDATFLLTIREATAVEVDLRDVDPTVGIDTIVYLRRTCTDAASQIACSDDIPCSESDLMTGCSGGLQVRQSRFTTRLEPGTYAIVADAFRYSGFDCGQVELRVGTP